MQANLLVDNTGDIDDGDYSAGQNTIREAIANASAGDTITFDLSLTGQTLYMDSAAITIDKDLNINGGGAVGGIHFSGNGNLYITDSTISNNEDRGNDGAGGLRYTGTGNEVILRNVTISDNGSVKNGGGIYIKAHIGF